MEIKQLRYFIEVAKREHISETALELNIAQSAISRQITLLEQELNVSLFKKQGRNITLTSEGKLLFNEALRIIEHLDSTIEQFQSHGLTKNKSIYIGYDESDVSHMLL
ncbi:LysR family transcriptional regulator, partial [Staphylococcus aureus]